MRLSLLGVMIQFVLSPSSQVSNRPGLAAREAEDPEGYKSLCEQSSPKPGLWISTRKLSPEQPDLTYKRRKAQDDMTGSQTLSGPASAT